jgi:hypothetical protein
MNRERAKELLPIIQAFVEEKDIEERLIGANDWLVNPDPNFENIHFHFRIKPLEFPPLPDGLCYHNPDNLTPEQVGPDHRLVVNGEFIKGSYCALGASNDLVEAWNGSEWNNNNGIGWMACASHISYRVPISTPFPEPPKKKVMVPLGPEDLRENMRFQHKTCENPGWFFTVVACQPDEIVCCSIRDQEFKRISFQGLQDEYRFSADYGKTWQPCEKEAVS